MTRAALARSASLPLLLLLVSCPRRAPAPAPAVEPEIRVGLGVGRDTVALGGDAELVLRDRGGAAIGTIPAGTPWRAVPDSGGLRLIRSDGSQTPRLDGVSAVPTTPDRFAMINGRRYRGRVLLSRDVVGLTVVNVLPLESYVAGVLGPEIGTRAAAESEAVLAQAIVSRTFALRNRGRWETLGFDAHADVRDQVYLGVSGETPAIWTAVRGTRGRVVRYRGVVIATYFHSTCGYRTASSAEAFRSVGARPYLQSVSDASGGGHYYCEQSPRFRWREEWDGPALRAILSRTLPGVVALPDSLPGITDMVISRTTASGRVGELRIVFPQGDARIPGFQVRDVLRPAQDRILLSTAFQLQVGARDGRGGVTQLVAVGAGSGHGVGLCQWGAIGRARAGQDHRRILTTYYPGTTVDRIY